MCEVIWTHRIEAIEDDQPTAEFPAVESQQIPPSGNAPNEQQITNNQEVKKKMIDFLKESFEFNEDVFTMSAIDAQMMWSFRTWRYRLYERMKKSEKEENIAAIKPDQITEEE
ncbi:hypothetical protein FNV43_RR10459 [Rhamnella rubrinervis]|uniref:Uncharacterized protein n=1 Tax=Rhamnella rubrinervis TaxID=2594499 RepID=A0A8K0HDB0_9ROSA|nr:hypothetical protein FNV43_RR10459 [Rhamnella rubrinervis]